MLDQVAELIREVAATVVLPRFRHLATDEVHQKAPGDLVTIADQESERELTRGLTALLPGSTVVGEEAAAADPGVLDRLDGRGPIWIVDPVDGTNNFAAGTARAGNTRPSPPTASSSRRSGRFSRGTTCRAR